MPDTTYIIEKDNSKPTIILVGGDSVGPRGLRGEPGYTPVKGVDYWTQADQEQIVDDVLAALPNSDQEAF